jgi:hypothetical protein
MGCLSTFRVALFVGSFGRYGKGRQQIVVIKIPLKICPTVREVVAVGRRKRGVQRGGYTEADNALAAGS